MPDHRGRPQNHAEFLEFVFGNRPAGSFAAIGYPVPVAGRPPQWPCNAWPEWKAQDFYTHYGVSSHMRTDQKEGGNKFRRRLTTWVAAHVFVLEDVGEEKEGGVTIAVPALEPTFIVETKPGSSHYGYVFTEPMFDAEKFERMQKAAVAKGINDPGGQNITRLVRLPGSLPIGKTHKAKLAMWSGKRFTPDEIICGLDLNLDAVVMKKGKAAEYDGEIGEDKVIDFLAAKGLLLSSDGEWFDIICPWHENHTDADISGTGYRTPTPSDPYRSFHCFHRCSDPSHPQGRKNTNAFLQWVRSNGGPNVETLDEKAAGARRKANMRLREGTDRGAVDPVLLACVNRLREARNNDERLKELNLAVWHLIDQGWYDDEIIRFCVHNCRLREAASTERIAVRVTHLIDEIRPKQERIAERATKQREKKQTENLAQRVERAMIALTRLQPKEQQAVWKWLGEQTND